MVRLGVDFRGGTPLARRNTVPLQPHGASESQWIRRLPPEASKDPGECTRRATAGRSRGWPTRVRLRSARAAVNRWRRMPTIEPASSWMRRRTISPVRRADASGASFGTRSGRCSCCGCAGSQQQSGEGHDRLREGDLWLRPSKARYAELREPIPGWHSISSRLRRSARAAAL
jgi:hypothetical protein